MIAALVKVVKPSDGWIPDKPHYLIAVGMNPNTHEWESHELKDESEGYFPPDVTFVLHQNGIVDVTCAPNATSVETLYALLNSGALNTIRNEYTTASQLIYNPSILKPKKEKPMKQKYHTSIGRNPKYLFVYGTLRHDMGGELRSGGIPVGLATVPGLLFSTGGYPAAIPPLVEVEVEPPMITGQLLDFTDLSDEEWTSKLNELDVYEGVPRLFNRRVITPNLIEEPQRRRHRRIRGAWMYYFTREELCERFTLIDSGDWKEFRT